MQGARCCNFAGRGLKRKQLPQDELSVRRDKGDWMGIGEGTCEGGARLDDGVIAKASVGYDDGVNKIFCSTTTMRYRCCRPSSLVQRW